MDDENEDDAKSLKGMPTAHKYLLKTGLYTFHLILKLVVNTVGLSGFRANNEFSEKVEPVTFNKYVKPPSDVVGLQRFVDIFMIICKSC